jgi:hypothetical protein
MTGVTVCMRFQALADQIYLSLQTERTNVVSPVGYGADLPNLLYTSLFFCVILEFEKLEVAVILFKTVLHFSEII